MYPAIATLRTGEAQSNVIMGVYKSDGALVWILASSRFLLEQRQGYALVTTFTDITELKRAEAQLQEKHQEGLEMQAYLKALHEITIKLTRTQTLDDFYRCTVEQALEHLGFERIGFFLAAPGGFVQGTYGTDVQGHLVDEHHFRSKLSDMSDIMQRTLNRRERFAFDEDAPLFENLKPVAKGLNAAAALWDGEILGWLTVDNAIHHQPISKLQLDILSLYAITVGTLLARKQAEEKTLLVSQRLELATHAGGIGIWDWHIIDNQMIWDERMGAIYGVNAEERSAITDRWYKLIHPDDQTRVIAEIAAALYQTPPFICEYRIVRRDGETRYIQSSAVVLHAENGAVERMVGVNLDVTDIKAAEQMLRSALEKEKELGELKSRFVSTASHEFRTPLAAILATTETLTYYRHRMDDAQIEARLEKIRQQVNHMKNIMENVLQLSRIQTGRIEFNPVSSDLDDLCRSIVEEFQSHSEYRERIVYTCLDTPVIVCMDLQLMRQIISNLVSNALKYSPSDKLIQIKLSCDTGSAICRVSDEGIGIPLGDLPRLFEPFHRGANVGAISGTGLGLSITKEAVEKHGGTLSVESEVGKGTTFTVMIPLACNKNEATHD
jgi:PAS domain S-box-containing protein